MAAAEEETPPQPPPPLKRFRCSLDEARPGMWLELEKVELDSDWGNNKVNLESCRRLNSQTVGQVKREEYMG